MNLVSPRTEMDKKKVSIITNLLLLVFGAVTLYLIMNPRTSTIGYLFVVFFVIIAVGGIIFGRMPKSRGRGRRDD